MPPTSSTITSDVNNPVPSLTIHPESTAHTLAEKENMVVRIADTIARYALMVLAFLLPVFLIPLPWVAVPQSKVLLATTLAMVTVLAWAFARIFEGTIHVPKSVLLWVTLLLPFAYFVSTIVSGWNSSSLVGLGIEQDTLVAVFMWYVVFALSVLVFHARRSGIRNHVRAIMSGLTVLALLQALYIFFPASFTLGGALQGATANPLGSWHDLGIISGLSFFLSFALFRSALFNGLWRSVLIVLGVLSLFLIVVVHFADVFWATAVLFSLGGIAVFRASLQGEGTSARDASLRVIPFVIVALSMAALAYWSVPLAENLPAKIQRTEVEVRPSWQGTFDVAKQSLGAPTSLVFGTGPNSFLREWGLHKPQGVNLTPFWNSDFNYGVGVIPTSIFAVGLFGLLAWAALLLTLFGLVFRFMREIRPLSPGRTLFGTLLVAVAYLVTFHMIYTPGVAVTGISFLLLGLLAVSATGDAPARTYGINVRTLGGFVAGVLLFAVSAGTLLAAGSAGREVASNLFVNKAAYGYQKNSDAGAAGKNLERSLAIAPKNDRAHRAAAELGIVELQQILNKGTPETEIARTQLQETLKKTIQHGLTAVEIDDSNYQNWLSLAQIYSNLAGVNVDGAYDNAKHSYESAFKTQPTNPVPKLRLGQLAVARNDLSAARTNLQEAITLKPDFAAAYYLLSQVEASDGKGDPAVTAAAQAVQLVPEDPLGWFNLGYILYSARSYENAAAALEKAASLTPNYSNALFILGLTYAAEGRTNDSVLVFTRVAELNPNEKWIPQLIANVLAKKDPFTGIQK